MIPPYVGIIGFEIIVYHDLPSREDDPRRVDHFGTALLVTMVWVPLEAPPHVPNADDFKNMPIVPFIGPFKP